MTVEEYNAKVKSLQSTAETLFPNVTWQCDYAGEDWSPDHARSPFMENLIVVTGSISIEKLPLVRSQYAIEAEKDLPPKVVKFFLGRIVVALAETIQDVLSSSTFPPERNAFLGLCDESRELIMAFRRDGRYRWEEAEVSRKLSTRGSHQ